MKIDRYIICPCRCDRFAQIVIDPEGTVCYTSDVEKLEAINAELLEAATNALWWWDGGNPISPKASDVMGRLRAAIAKAKGEVMP